MGLKDTDVSISGFITDGDILYVVKNEDGHIAEIGVNDLDFKSGRCRDYNKIKLNELCVKLYNGLLHRLSSTTFFPTFA